MENLSVKSQGSGFRGILGPCVSEAAGLPRNFPLNRDGKEGYLDIGGPPAAKKSMKIGRNPTERELSLKHPFSGASC